MPRTRTRRAQHQSFRHMTYEYLDGHLGKIGGMEGKALIGMEGYRN